MDEATKNHDIITEAERKLTVLELSKSYSDADIAKTLQIPVKEVAKIREHALRDAMDHYDMMGRAYAAQHLNTIEDLQRGLVKQVKQLERIAGKITRGTVEAAANGDEESQENIEILTEEAALAMDLSFKATDRIVKLMERSAKMLGLDKPTELALLGGGNQTPQRVANAAMELEAGTKDITPRE